MLPGRGQTEAFATGRHANAPTHPGGGGFQLSKKRSLFRKRAHQERVPIGQDPMGKKSHYYWIRGGDIKNHKGRERYLVEPRIKMVRLLYQGGLPMKGKGGVSLSTEKNDTPQGCAARKPHWQKGFPLDKGKKVLPRAERENRDFVPDRSLS